MNGWGRVVFSIPWREREFGLVRLPDGRLFLGVFKRGW
jgi:hypothetical protein